MKKETQSLNDLRAIARTVFQSWVRLRDENLACISCEKTVTQQLDGGHYLKAEIYTGLIFDEINCNKQCCNCNDHLQGNVIEYRKGMIKKYSEDQVNALELKSDLSRVYKFSRYEFQEIISKYREKIKQLKSIRNVGYPIAEQINK